MTPARADIAVIGGTGLYSLLDDGGAIEVDTPYGRPSSVVRIHQMDGRRVAFLARHGFDHRYPAHRVPYRANMWALASLGVTRVLAPCAVGSLREDYAPGEIAIPDQLIDRSHGRESTFYDTVAVHVPFADPYCAHVRATVINAAERSPLTHHDRATVAVVPGPRFGTRAEAGWHRQSGADLVNMTALPEAALARELALCYANIAVVTDWDAGLGDTGQHATQAQVMRRFDEAVTAVRALIVDVALSLPDERRCPCPSALDGTGAPRLIPQDTDVFATQPRER